MPAKCQCCHLRIKCKYQLSCVMYRLFHACGGGFGVNHRRVDEPVWGRVVEIGSRSGDMIT